jgi:HSP20 family molecular chaperone IbpA
MKNTNNKGSLDVWDTFDELFADFASAIAPGGACNRELYHTPSFPPVNVFIDEESKDLLFEFAIAGYGKEDVDVTFEGDKMVLQLKSITKKEPGLKALKRGFKRPAVETAFIIPSAKYETENAEASVEDGVLTINIPATEKTKPKKITIK